MGSFAGLILGVAMTTSQPITPPNIINNYNIHQENNFYFGDVYQNDDVYEEYHHDDEGIYYEDESNYIDHYNFRLNYDKFNNWAFQNPNTSIDWYLANVLGNVMPYYIQQVSGNLDGDRYIDNVYLITIDGGRGNLLQIVSTWMNMELGSIVYNEIVDGYFDYIELHNGQIYLSNNYGNNITESFPYYLK